jgi:hypothetical protein
MRLSRDQLIFRALVVLDEAVSACGATPIKPSIGLRFALMFLYAVSDGTRRHYDGFWRSVQDAHANAHSEQMGRDMRTTAARGSMTGIARSVGIEMTAEFCQSLSVARLPIEERVARRQREAELAAHRARLVEEQQRYVSGPISDDGR